MLPGYPVGVYELTAQARGVPGSGPVTAATTIVVLMRLT
jgi:hypothetical protein